MLECTATDHSAGKCGLRHAHRVAVGHNGRGVLEQTTVAATWQRDAILRGRQSFPQLSEWSMAMHSQNHAAARIAYGNRHLPLLREAPPALKLSVRSNYCLSTATLAAARVVCHARID